MQDFVIEAYSVAPDGRTSKWATDVAGDSDTAVRSAKAYQALGTHHKLNGRVLIRGGGEWIAGFSYGVIPYGWMP